MNEKRWRDGTLVLPTDPATTLSCELMALIKTIGLCNFFVCSTTAILTHLDQATKADFRAGHLSREQLQAVQSRVEDLCQITDSIAPGWEDVVQSWGEDFDEVQFIKRESKKENGNGH